MDFRERLIVELEELTIKIDRLALFLSDKDIVEEYALERKQFEIMNQYKDCLERRILKLMK